MNSLELVNKLYKPFRITKLNKCTIIDSLDGSFAIKEKGDKDIKELYSYLKSRAFTNYPNLIDESRSDINIYEYIEDTDYPIEQKSCDMIRVVGDLHKKTSFEREVTEDKFKEIYDSINGNIEYFKNKYEDYSNLFEKEVFMSPSHYLFMCNYSKLMSELAFCKSKLDDWYESVKDKKSIRVSTIHNNLSLEHFLKGDKEVLISWDKSRIDTPIMDFYVFYRKEALNLEFSSILKTYLKYCSLDEYELDLLFIMICMPMEIDFVSEEFESCENVSKVVDYVFKTETLVRPYYLKDDEKQKN